VQPNRSNALRYASAATVHGRAYGTVGAQPKRGCQKRSGPRVSGCIRAPPYTTFDRTP
jgi:hypothetical protein